MDNEIFIREETMPEKLQEAFVLNTGKVYYKGYQKSLHENLEKALMNGIYNK